MLNSVQNVKQLENKPFADFNRKEDYYITPEIAKDIFDKSERDSEKKGRKVGAIIASASVLTALVVFGLTKGLPKNTYRWLEKLGQKLEDKVNARKLKGESGPITSLFNYTLKTVQKFTKKSKSINNFTSFKDLLFTKLMSKTAPTKKVHSKITDVFENLARKTVKRRYGKFDKNFSRLMDYYGGVNKKIAALNPENAETVQKIEQLLSSIKTQTENGFGKPARMARYSKMKDNVKGLDDKVMDTALNGMKKSESFKENFKRLLGSKVHQSFIAEDLLASEKLALAKDVSLLRHTITHDIMDNYRASDQLVKNLSSVVNPRDAETGALLKEVRSKLSMYNKLSGNFEMKYREVLNEDIISVLRKISDRIKTSAETFGYNDANVKQVSEFVKEMEGTLGKSDKGQFQELLTLYKSVLPKGEYDKLRAQTYKTIKSLDNAINTETNSFFDKLRDLSLGAAPTDILTILGSVVGVGIGLTKADNKDERISATLNYGIPIVGAVATSLTMTVCLVSGVWAMGAGLASGWAMNKIGKYIDTHRKHITKQIEDNRHAEAVKAEINSKKA